MLLLDIHVCESEGMEVLRMIATDYPMTKVIVVSNCTELTHRQFWTKGGAYTFCDKGRGLAATRCMRCMLEGLAGQIDNQTSLMTRSSKWSRTAHGTRH